VERDALVQLLRSNAPADETTTAGGTLLLSNVSVETPMAYLHSIYPPLDRDAVQALQDELSVVIPEPYRRFLRTANGLDLFLSTVSLFGLRGAVARDMTEFDWPFSLVTPNVHERPRNLEEGALVIGSYSYDDSPIVLHHAHSSVVCTTPDGDQLRATWPDLDTFLKQEISRLADLLQGNYTALHEAPLALTLPGKPGDADQPPGSPGDKPWWRFW
jgi:hypothetical protein